MLKQKNEGLYGRIYRAGVLVVDITEPIVFPPGISLEELACSIKTANILRHPLEGSRDILVMELLRTREGKKNARKIKYSMLNAVTAYQFFQDMRVVEPHDLVGKEVYLPNYSDLIIIFDSVKAATSSAL